jgi:CrcB protein
LWRAGPAAVAGDRYWFFGGFSTFSSFIGELHTELRQGHWAEVGLLAAGSVLAGLLALKAGLMLGLAP